MAQINQIEMKVTTPEDLSKLTSKEENSQQDLKKEHDSFLVFDSPDEEEQNGIQIPTLNQKPAPKFMKDIKNSQNIPSDTFLIYQDKSLYPSLSFQKHPLEHKFTSTVGESNTAGHTSSKSKSKVSFVKLDTTSFKLINVSDAGYADFKDKSSPTEHPVNEKKKGHNSLVVEAAARDRKTSLLETFASLFHSRKKDKKLSNDSKATNSLERIETRQFELINDKAYFVEELTGQTGVKKKPKKQLPRLKQLLQKHNIIKQDVQADFVKRILAKVRRNRQGSVSKTLEIMVKCYAKLQECIDAIKQLFRNLILPVLPDSKLKVIWDTVGAFLVLFEMLFIPFQIGFEFDTRDRMSDFENLKTIYFFLDILLMFHTAFSHEGTLVINHKKIAMYYLKNFFYYDLIASLPYPSFFSLFEGWFPLRFLRLILLLRFLRLVRLDSIFSKIKDDMHSQVINSLVSLIKLLSSIIFLAHLVACVWHFVGLLVYDANGVSWISQFDFLEKDTIDRYVASLYWTIMTMITVGYGDIFAVTVAERILNIFVMLLGCGVFGYSMNSIGILLQNINAGVSKKRQKYYIINKFMKRKHLSKETQAKAQQYLDYLFETNNEEKSEEIAILAMLSDGIQEQIRKEINGKVLKENLLFQEVFGNKFLGLLSNYLEEKIYSPGEGIYDEHDKQFYVFFISSGSVNLCCCENKQKMITLEKGQYFGEVSFFTSRPSDFNAISASFASIFFLRKQKFLEILEDYPPEKEMFHFVKDEVILYNDLKPLKIRCFSCDKNDHQITTCPVLHYIPNRSRIIEMKLYEEATFMKRYFRRKKVRYHALAQLHETQSKSERFRDKQIETKPEPVLQTNRQTEEEEIFERSMNRRKESRRSRRVSLRRRTKKGGDDQSLTDLEFTGPEGYVIIAGNRNPRVIKMNTAAEKSLTDVEYQINSLGYPLFLTPTALNDDDDNTFDTVMNFQIYFPHNNITKIIESIDQQNFKRSKKKEIQSQIQELREDTAKSLVLKSNQSRHRGSLQLDIQSKGKYWSFLFGENPLGHKANKRESQKALENTTTNGGKGQENIKSPKKESDSSKSKGGSRKRITKSASHKKEKSVLLTDDD